LSNSNKSLSYSLFKLGFEFVFISVKLLYFFKLEKLFQKILFYFLKDIIKYRERVILKNIQHLGIDNEASVKVLNDFYQHLSELVFETIWCFKASPSSIKEKVEISNMEVFDQIYDSGKNATILLSHIGNWELFCQWSALYIPRLNVVTLYTPIKNNALNQLLLEYRQRFGVQMVSTKATLDLYRKQKTLNPCINLFAVDQNPGAPFEQYWTRFFDAQVPVISGAEKFAISQKQDVYYLKITKNPQKYTLVLQKIDYDNNTPFDLTIKQMKVLEENILLNPALWLLSHNRFKYANQK
jgi:KDO2-lipid IV(A) lauroyltransferase